MKYTLAISFLFASLVTCGQSKKVREVLANSRELEKVVFETKDSVRLDKLFAKTLIYVHSSGKAETREEAIRGIVNNKSVYLKEASPAGYNVNDRDDSLVVVHVFKAKETKADGSTNNLDLTLELVWAKENGDWKLFRRKATRNNN